MANKRSVIVIGVTGCGKSTVCNKIIGEEKRFNIVPGFKAGTTEIDKETKLVDYEDKKLEITVIDTIGLSDAHRKSEDTVTAIQQIIKKIGGLNLILFVIKHSRLTDAETTVLNIIDENMKDTISAYSAIVITQCENLDEVGRKDAIKTLQEDCITKKLASRVEKGIHTVGFPNMQNFPTPVRPYFDGVAKSDSEKLLKLVYEAEKWYRYDEIFNVSCLESLTLAYQAIIEYLVTSTTSSSS